MDGYDPTVPTNIVYVDGADQRGRVGTRIRYPLLARITNQFGGGVAGVRVDWYIVAGRGSLSDSTSISNIEGMVCNTLRLGDHAEDIRVQAVVALSGSPLYFNSTAVLAPDRGEGEPESCAP
jgi:phage tail tube protein FII